MKVLKIKIQNINASFGLVEIKEETDTNAKSEKVPPAMASGSTEVKPLIAIKPKPQKNRTSETTECTTCGQKVLSSVIEFHMLAHSVEELCRCDVCNLKFPTGASLHRHKRKAGHNNWKFKCPNCRITFAQECHLRRHRVTCDRRYRSL